MISKALGLLVGYLGFRAIVNRTKLPSECLLTFEESCVKSGIKLDTHWVTTKDGYILRLYRLGKLDPVVGPPVLFVHGLTSNSQSFTMCRSTTPPAYNLLNQGFDVWLLNTRGNYLSRLHKTLDTSDEKYWEWSAYDIGISDIPATIDYVLMKTQYKQLNYIGHSQGGLVLLQCLSYLPEYNKKVNVAALMAPVGGTIEAKAKYFERMVSKWHTGYLDVLGKKGFGEYSHGGSFRAKLAYRFPKLGYRLYKDRYDAAIGNDSIVHMPYYLQKAFGGTSVHNLKYYNQLIQKKSPLPFAYDFGDGGKNLAKYGQATPPRADFSKITSKIALFYGIHDTVVSLKDSEILLMQLPKSSVIFKQIDCNLDHGGFVISNTQPHFTKISEIFKSHQIQDIN